MKLLTFARASGAAFALVLVGFAVARATLPLPGTNGPTLGDANINLYSLTNAYIQSNQKGNQVIGGTGGVDQTAGQANCTQMGNFAMGIVTSSTSTGYVCLPPAVAGWTVSIANSTGQTIDLYTSASTVTANDSINGLLGTAAYTGLTTLKNTVCFSPQAGAWFCSSGS